MRELALALFAGSGGGLLGSLLLDWTPVAAIEKNPFRREVLLRRQVDGLLPLFPIWDNVETFDGKPWRGLVDVVTGGFPCQPFSVAGVHKGASDDRNRWPDTIRIIREVRPRFAYLENVANLTSNKFGTILGDLSESGFRVRWDCVPASSVGACHQRDRLWIVADSGRGLIRDESKRGEGSPRSPVEGNSVARDDGKARKVADSDEGRRKIERAEEPSGEQGSRRDLSHGRGSIRELGNSEDERSDS